MSNVRLNVEMSRAERQALKRLALDRGMTVKALVSEALEYRYPTIVGSGPVRKRAQTDA